MHNGGLVGLEGETRVGTKLSDLHPGDGRMLCD